MSAAVEAVVDHEYERCVLSILVDDPTRSEAMRLTQSARWFNYCGGRNIATGDARVHKAAFLLYKLRAKEASRGA